MYFQPLLNGLAIVSHFPGVDLLLFVWSRVYVKSQSRTRGTNHPLRAYRRPTLPAYRSLGRGLHPACAHPDRVGPRVNVV